MFENFAIKHAKRITLYRPERLMGLDWHGPFKLNGSVIAPAGYYPRYETGDLRAKFFGVRVPILWALDCLLFAGVLKHEENP